MLGVDPAADADTIKKAFRREIARYHPDKVTHLGPEFQEMASTRAAELTTAYKILSDPGARADYDAEVLGDRAPSPSPRPAAPSDSTATSTPATERQQDEREEDASEAPAPGPGRFDQERAGRDDIVRRAVMGRLRDVLQQTVGACDMSPIRGFDLACLSKARASLFRRTVPPSVLVRLAPIVDGPVATAAWLDAVKARIQQKPIILLLIGNRLAPAGELARAIEDQRRRNPALAEVMFPIAVDLRDWSAKIPANAPESARELVQKLKNFAG